MQYPDPSSRTALITGASRRLGLGYATARLLAERGYHVILTARTLSSAEELSAELRGCGFAATALRVDVADNSSIRELADILSGRTDHLDVLVNNASRMPDFRTRSALDVDMDALRALFEVNVFGCWGLPGPASVPPAVAGRPDRQRVERRRSADP